MDRASGPDILFCLSAARRGCKGHVGTSGHNNSLHQAAAEAFLSCRPHTLLEASGVLRHGLVSGAMRPVVATLNALEKLPKEVWPQIAQQFLWLMAIALMPGERIFPATPFVSTLLRHFQFYIAAEVSSDTLAPLVSEAWEREILEIDIPEVRLLMRLVFLTSTVLRYQVPFPQRTIVSRAVEAICLAKERASLFDPNRSGAPDNLPPISASKQLIIFAIARCKSINDLDEFLSALEEQADEIRAEVLLPFQERYLLGKLALQQGLVQRSAYLITPVDTLYSDI